MSSVFILVEGATEEKFVKELLKPYFEEKNIFLTPINLNGVSKYSIIKKETLRLLKATHVSLVTTMIDFYASPSDMPGISNIQEQMSYIQKIKILEEAFRNDIDDIKFLPYLQLHEFEALLFSDVSHFSLLSSNISNLEKIANEKNPEEINDNPSTTPSKRIIKEIPKYEFSKPTNGIIIAKRIGLKKMRKKCEHFNDWIESIENICEMQGAK